ncbi:aspartyl/asparaginyl beta-hydroxylase domain-containing protein [Massilia sp. CT11-137]|uniref:aspartyl/asparaginyl beta-hydroxylase domain-containing protein n=1 Tax=Massilia sp. CT11-137 TaxID=3393901 RepID=UPI0039AF677E
MNKIRLLASGLNVEPIRAALAANPHLWDQHTARTASIDSPHHGLSDIWARFAPPGANGDADHDAIWYPAAECLPLRELVYPLMAAVHGDRLGGVLITRIPPGAECKPHVDHGWHARYYDKFAIQIAAAPGQAFCFEGEQLVTAPGDLFWFDNSYLHWVTNPTTHERITLIVCIKTDKE